MTNTVIIGVVALGLAVHVAAASTPTAQDAPASTAGATLLVGGDVTQPLTRT
jgi:hypothetical protein